MCEEPTIAIVDDEMEVQRSLCFLLKTVGYRTDIYSSAEEFQGNYGYVTTWLCNSRFTHAR